MQNQYFRTFIGVPAGVGEQFLQAREELISALHDERISWVSPDLYHVTIRFLGDTEIRLVKEIGGALRKHVKQPGKSLVQLHRLGSFGPPKKPRVVWVGFEGTQVFESLRQGVDRALGACGFLPAEQSFRAHLTLGRIRSLHDIRKFYRIIEERKDAFTGTMHLERMVFYRSVLGNGGPVYTPLEVMEFGD